MRKKPKKGSKPSGHKKSNVSLVKKSRKKKKQKGVDYLKNKKVVTRKKKGT